MSFSNRNGDAGQMNIKQSGKDFVLEVCRESTRNRCSRSESQCRYAHPPPNVQVIEGKVQCCADFLKGRCFRVEPPCRYFHPPPHLAMELMSQGDSGTPRLAPPANTADNLLSALASAKTAADMIGSAGSGVKQCERMEVCRDFLRGRCQRDDCRFAHPSDHVAVDTSNLVIVCIDFLNGRCSRTSCRYFHPPAHLAKSKSAAAGEVCRDFLVGRCNRSNCRYVHSAEAKVAETRQRSDGSSDVCKDFLNGRCNRTMCRYYHPPMTQQPQPTQAAPTVMSSAAESTSLLLGKRPHSEYDSLAGYNSLTNAGAGDAQYALQEGYDVPAKRPFTGYE